MNILEEYGLTVDDLVWSYSSNYPNYQIHSDGVQVRNRTTKRVLKPKLNQRGATQYTLNKKTTSPSQIEIDVDLTNWAIEHSPMMLAEVDRELWGAARTLALR